MPQTIKAYFMLSLCVFSLFIFVAAPFELYQVYLVNSWPPQQAKVQKIEYTQSQFRTRRMYWKWDLELTKTQEQVSTADVQPGDLPFEILFWSTNDWHAARYHQGQITNVYRAPEGGKTYLQRGSYTFMTAIWILSAVFWAWILRRAKYKLKQE